ncbi:MAG: hypothetical protein JOY53_05085 [Acidobacteriaceae bacterium]|nr:hypothetical protein [Acidobacteriaceae bacterium]
MEAYVEKVLAPSLLRRGQSVVLDDLGAHKSERARKPIEGGGCKLLFLPAYSHRALIPSRKLSRRSRVSLAKSPSPNPPSPDRSARGSDLDGQRKGCSGLLRTQRLRFIRPASMKSAVGSTSAFVPYFLTPSPTIAR